MNRPTSTIALSLLLLSLPLLAQPRPAARQGGTVSGVVTTVSGSLITILEGWVTIDATTQCSPAAEAKPPSRTSSRASGSTPY